MLLYPTFMMSIVPQAREINSTLVQNRVDSYIFYSHVTHYTHTHKSLISNTPQGLNFQQGRSKYMFLSVFINSCIHTVCHILPRDCQHKTSKHLVTASNYMKKESMTYEEKKMCTDFGLYFSTQTYTFWFKTLHSTVLILEKNFMADLYVVTSEPRTF
jgi:hypothetical protein